MYYTHKISLMSALFILHELILICDSMNIFGKYKDLADAVKNPCHLNMAACMLKLNKYEDAIAQCSLVSMSRFPSYASVCERTHLHIYYIHAHDVDRLLS